jgi:hypothetical protein
MASSLVEGVSQLYRSADTTKTVTIDPDLNSLVLSDTVTNKVLTINSQQLSNNSGQSLLFADIYTSVNKIPAINYPSDNATTLNITDTVIIGPVGGGANTSKITNGSLIINDGLGATIDLTVVGTYVSNAANDAAEYAPDHLRLYNTSSPFETEINLDSVTITSSSGQLLQLLNNTTSPYVVPTLLLRNDAGNEVSLRFNELNCDSNKTFVFNNNNRFFKQMNPVSFLLHELVTGDTIYKYMSFVFFQPASPSDSLNLLGVSEYLDDNNLPGWSFIISNYANHTIDIITSGINNYSHVTNLSASPIVIGKWTTCRITLVLSQTDGYLWSVARF